MELNDFQTLLSRGDKIRRSIQIGSLLVEDTKEAGVRNNILSMNGILVGNPQIFSTKNDFLDWMNRDDQMAKQVANMILKGRGNDLSTLDSFLAELREDMKRWDEAVWDRQTGRHDYWHTRPSFELDRLPGEFAVLFPVLERLCLWSVGVLSSLPIFPSTLKCLDLRNARALTEVKALPESIETLDLTGCTALKNLPQQKLPRLKRLFLSRCHSLTQEEFRQFWARAECAGTMEELELHGNGWLISLEDLEDCLNLRSLRLSECIQLATLPCWKKWPELQHLDLRQCGALSHLPSLPIGKLGYLGLHGCHKLREYLSQDLNERDLGLESGDNMADLFRLRTRLGADIFRKPRCKLLFLGNGRGGKTTLAKALQYCEMDEKSRSKHPELEPREGEGVSHAIQQWEWRTDLSSHGEAGIPEATIRIWDFGGQETYHGTHRVFAASGALYIVVLRDRNPEPIDPNPDPLQRLPDKEWKQYNRQRPVAYWLDYILDLDRSHGARHAARARVLLVHTGMPSSKDPRHVIRELAKEHQEIVVGEWFVGSLEAEWSSSDFNGAFRTALKKELHRQVCEEGVRIPCLFGRIMERVQNSVQSVTDVGSPGAVMNWKDWRIILSEAARECAAGDLDETEARAVTRCLHRSGELFWMHGHDSSVILHQKSALAEIYRLLDFRETQLKAFRAEVRAKFGLFDARKLREDWWKNHATGLQNQLLEFMSVCQLCVPVFHRGTDGVVGEPMLALDPTLLPAREGDLDTELFAEFRQPASRFGLTVRENQTWRLKVKDSKPRPFSESGFRSLQIWAVHHLGNQVRLWCNGLQFVSEDSNNPVGFKLQWVGEGNNPDAYGGSLLIDYWVRPGKLEIPQSAQQMVDWLMGPGSPYPREEWLTDLEVEPSKSSNDPKKRRDVAISVRGVQAADAGRLEKCLSDQGLNVFLYSEDQGLDRMSQYYDAIRKAVVQVLWVSHEYLSTEYTNRYSLHECASAIFVWARSRGMTVNEVHLNDLPAENDQTVVIVFENKKDEFEFDIHLYTRLVSCFDAMVSHLDVEIKVASKEESKIKNAKYQLKFQEARRLAESFASYYWDLVRKPVPVSITLEFVIRAPKTADGIKSLGERLVALSRTTRNRSRQ